MKNAFEKLLYFWIKNIKICIISLKKFILLSNIEKIGTNWKKINLKLIKLD